MEISTASESLSSSPLPSHEVTSPGGSRDDDLPSRAHSDALKRDAELDTASAHPKTAKIKRSMSTPNMWRQETAEAATLAQSAAKMQRKLGYHRSSVSCGHCRRRKIRCIPAPTDPQNRCSNCIRLKKECNFYPIDQQRVPDLGGGESEDESSKASDCPSLSGSVNTQTSLPYSHLHMPPIQDLGGDGSLQIGPEDEKGISRNQVSSLPPYFEYLPRTEAPATIISPSRTKFPLEPAQSFWRVNPQDSPLTHAFSPFTPNLQTPPEQTWSTPLMDSRPRDGLMFSISERPVSSTKLALFGDQRQPKPFPPDLHPIPDDYKAKLHIKPSGMYPPPLEPLRSSMSQDQAPAVPTQPEVLITASQSLEPQCIENPLGNSNSPRGFTLDKIRHVLLECLSEADHIFPPAHSRQKSTFQDDFCEDQRETTTLGTLSSNLQGREYKAAFAVQWDVKAFMSTQYAKWDASSLRSVITLTGNSLNAQAATCEDYLLQNWPITGKLLLVVLQKAISGGRSTTKEGTLTVEIKIGLKNLTCHVFGQAEEIIQIAQQLAWLGTALQHSHSGELAYSSSKIVPTATASPIFYLTFDTRPLEENRKCCWHGLFAAAVIAEGFPIPTRQQGIGLEIPLQMMAALAGVRHAVSLEGGLILKGYSCAFVPVKRYDDSVQWHFTENDAEDRLPYWEVQTQYPARAGLKDVDFEALSHTRAFVGWWGLTETHLGTEEVDYSNLDYSSAEDAGKSIQFGGVTLGFQQIVSGEVNFSLGSRDGKLHMERSGPYQKIIRCAAKTPVLLYDHDEKRAWLVPSSAVILHIARTRHTREPYTKGGKPISFPFASPRENRHSSADQILLEHASFELSGSEDFDSQSYYLRDVVRDVWSRLETLLDMNVRKERASEQDVRIPLKHFLRGWEFMALVEDISPLREKEASIQRSSGGWTRLAKDIDAVVLFASGFGDIIRPSDEACDSGLCKRWSSVPRGKDYLAASCAMLSQLFDRAGSRLTQKYLTSTHLRWNRGQVLWGRCESRSHQCNCDRLQGIVKNSAECFGTVTEPGLLEADGAVIFGQTSHSFPITRPLQKHQPLYSQENVGFLSEDSSACNGFVDSGQCFIQGPVSATRLSPATGDVGLLGDSPTRSLPKELVKSDTKNKQSLLLKKDREEESELGIQMPCRPPKRRLEQEEEYGILIQTPSTTPLSTRNHPDNVSTKSVHIENYRDLRLRRKGNFKQLKNIPDYICCDHGVDTKVFKTADETERVGMENHRLFEK